MKTKLGITFSGGGGKGAYEIGVWKALKEYGVDKNIQAVSGTSVGALNGALFVKGDYEIAEEICLNISQNQILQPDTKSILAKITGIAGTAIVEKIAPLILGLKNKGVFKQDGLKQIIKESISPEDIQDGLPCYVCATQISPWQPIYKKLNELDYDLMVQYLLASAAIPIAFGRMKVEEKTLLDGFLTDNTPVRPLIEQEKCNKIITVMLGQKEVFDNYKYPNVKFWSIVPSEDINELFGGLDFTAETAKKLLNMGYTDTCKILQEIYEFSLIEEQYIENAEIIKLQDQGFKKLVLDNSFLRNQYKKIESNENMSSIQFLLENSGNEIIKQEPAELNFNQTDYEEKLDNEICEAEKIMINSSLDETINKMGENSEKMMEFVFDGITALASTEGRINSQKNQGIISRIWGNMTGANQKVQAEVNWQFKHAIYANQQMIKKLADRNNLTMDVCISLANKVNYLSLNQKSLQLQDIKQLKMIKQLHSGILNLADSTRNAINIIDSDIQKLKYGQELLFWRGEVLGDVNNLNQYEKIMKITSKYCSITKNEIANSADKLFYSALCNSGLGDNQTINPATFIEFVIENKQKSNELLFNNIDKSSVLPIPQHKENWMPLLKSIEIIYDSNKEVSFNEVMQLLEDRFNMNLSTEIPITNFAFELLNGFRMANRLTNDSNSLRDEMIANLAEMLKILGNSETNLFDDDIKVLQQEVAKFAIIVPLVGKYSSGKSRLLNLFLGEEEFLKTDTAATTALATELLYSQNEYAIVHYIDGSSKQIKFDKIDELTSEKILYLQLYLNNPKLKNREDLILVDMPGLESGVDFHNKAINLYVDKGHHYIMIVSVDAYTDYSIIKSIIEFKSYKGISTILTKADKKSPSQILEIKEHLKKTVQQKISDDVFIGVTKPGDISDFEKVIDNIYSDKQKIFRLAFSEKYSLLHNKIINYFDKLIKVQFDSDKLDECIKEQNIRLEKTRKMMLTKLDDLKWNIVNEASNEISEKISNILNANESSLISAARGGNLKGKITDIIRPPLNNIMRSVISKAMEDLKEETKNIQQEMDCDNFLIPQIDIPIDDITKAVMGTGGAIGGVVIGGVAGVAAGGMAATGALTGSLLGPVGAIVGGLFGLGIGLLASNSAKEEKEDNFKAKVRSVISQAITDITNNSKEQLAIIHQNIKTIVENMLNKVEDEAKESIDKIKEDIKKNEDEYNKQKENRIEIVENLNKLK